MSNELPETNDTDLVQDELTVLKKRADVMGISYHPSIGLDKLKEKVNAVLTDGPVTATEEETKPSDTKTETEGQRKLRLKKEASKLVRIRVTCMNPNKKEWEGEIFTVSNAVVGTYKKMVPFNLDEGYHVPQIIYEQLKERKCQVFQTVKDNRGNKMRKGKLINEFNIEVLPPLTEAELKDLAQRQALSHAVD